MISDPLLHTKNLFIFWTALLPFSGCFCMEGLFAWRADLPGGYMVSNFVVLEREHRGYAFHCKLGSESDPVVPPNVTAVEWGERAIIVTQEREGRERFFLIVPDSARSEVECGQRDRRLGPFPRPGLDRVRKQMGLPDDLGNSDRLGFG